MKSKKKEEGRPSTCGVEIYGDGSVCVYCPDIEKAATIAETITQRFHRRVITDLMYR